MRLDVAENLSRSAEDFTRIVWPVIGERFGEMIPVESVTANPFAKELDCRAGVDSWLIGADERMRPMASRVQWCDTSWETFTIRSKSRHGLSTEYDKRRAEIDTTGVLTPHYFCHAYVSTDHTRLVGAAIALMRDVILSIDENTLERENRGDGTRFYVVKWSTLRRSGKWIETWPLNDTAPQMELFVV